MSQQQGHKDVKGTDVEGFVEKTTELKNVSNGDGLRNETIDITRMLCA